MPRAPARAARAAHRGVEAAAVDRHERVAAVGVDRDPAALARAAVGHERAGVERAVQHAAAVQDVRDACPSSRRRCRGTSGGRRRGGRAWSRCGSPRRSCGARAPAGRRGASRRRRRRARLRTGCRPRMPSARQVAGPTTPSAVRPRRRWKRLTARYVPGPKTPSAATPSLRCSSRTLDPRDFDAPAAARPPRGGPALERAPRAGAGDAVGLHVAPALEALDRAHGALAEDAVGVDAQQALELADGGAAVAALDGLLGEGEGALNASASSATRTMAGT